MKIYVATHKKVKFPKNKEYEPIQVGADINQDIKLQLKDNIGENISDKNRNYCELTVLYWIWKNCTNDIIGLVHYRRYFFKAIFENDLRKILNKEEIERIFKDYNIILPKKIFLKRYNVYEQYKKLHNINDLEECRKVINEKYPDYINSFDKIMQQKSFYAFNMFIGNRIIINDYFKWLFDILFELENRIDISKYDKYNARVYGFLSERLFNVWIEKNIDRLKIRELYVNNIEENPLKHNIQNKIKEILMKMGI